MGSDARIPIHFLTIVLDGESYINSHIEIFKNLSLPWHWHIIQGTPKSTTASPRPDHSEAHLLPREHSEGSPSALLPLIELAQEHPDSISLHRKPLGQRWEDTIEMLSAPLENITGECLLWQVDRDEVWSSGQIHAMTEMFQNASHRYAALFKRARDKRGGSVPSSRLVESCSTMEPECRVWRYQPGMKWVDPELPKLTVLALDGTPYRVDLINPFTVDEIENAELTPKLIDQRRFNRSDISERLLIRTSKQSGSETKPRVAIDGVFFQLNSTGIARLWHSLLRCWATTGAIAEVLLLDRDNTMPKIPGARYKSIPRYTIGQGEEDREMLQRVLDEEDIPLFASTYYTSVKRAKTLQLVYDLIPEVLRYDTAREPAWIEKHHAFAKANFFACISQNTRRDLHSFFPHIPHDSSEVLYCGVDRSMFKPPSAREILELHSKYNLTKPYFLLVGSGGGYKNAVMLVEALSLLNSQHGFEILLVTSSGVPGELVSAASQGIVRPVKLSDTELCAAYGGAVAFVYPSLYEGFGLPILEAMACDCPVIANHAASLPEVAGPAALYARNPGELATALCEVQKPEVRQRLIQAGRERIQMFTWEKSATQLWNRIVSLTEDSRDLPKVKDLVNHINPFESGSIESGTETSLIRI